MPEAVTHTAVVVAHGAPSAPAGPERAMQELAKAVQKEMPDNWVIRGATLAAPGALDAAVQELSSTGRLQVFPHFMADGWFTTEELPRRLRAAAVDEFDILPAFGLDPAVYKLCLRRASEAALAEGHAPGSAALVVAAHGSPSDPRPARAAAAAKEFLARSGPFREVLLGFVDEEPYLADAARISAPALCLPFFAGRAGHVEIDLPEALAQAAFTGKVLEPIGTDPGVPAIIAASILRNVAERLDGARSPV